MSKKAIKPLTPKEARSPVITDFELFTSFIWDKLSQT